MPEANIIESKMKNTDDIMNECKYMKNIYISRKLENFAFKILITLN